MKQKRMKVAVLFDFIEASAGGEKLMRFLAQRYNADIYTGYVNWDRTYKEFKDMNINIIGNIPRIQLLKQEMLVRSFRKLDLSSYDAVIALGFYTIYASERNRNIIWYPYGVSPLFYKKGDIKVKENLPRKVGGWIWKKRIRSYDKKVVSKNIGKIVTLSEYSRKVFNEYYGRDSVIIPPPVDMKKHYYKSHQGYYLIVQRLQFAKRIDIAIEAFKRMPVKTLWIEGIGPAREYLEKLAKGYENIRLLGRVDSDKLPELYANCIALIATAYHDDWSMPMVEALASGKPCIAVNHGAYPEIVNDKTGMVVNGTSEGIVEGVNKITSEIAEEMKDDCIKRANNWSTEEFGKKWDKVIDAVLEKMVRCECLT